MTEPRTIAVVVTYLPEAERFQTLLNSLLAQVDQVLVVDNTPAGRSAAEDVVTAHPAYGEQLRIVRCGENVGIAAALNIGIGAAISEKFDYVLLSDQDSLPAPRMVAELLDALDWGVAHRRKVGAVGPAYMDEVTGQLIPFQIEVPGRCFYKSTPIDADGPPVEVLTMISSGKLIPCETIRSVGGMREDLFIDHVDTEWCHRARAEGYVMYGAPRARLSHRLGDDAFWVWSIGWRRYTDYTPLRLYYRFRNFLLLWRMGHVDLCWKVRASWYWLGDLYAHVFFSSGRFRKIAMILKGLAHGILGRSGPYRN